MRSRPAAGLACLLVGQVQLNVLNDAFGIKIKWRQEHFTG